MWEQILVGVMVAAAVLALLRRWLLGAGSSVGA